MDFSSAEKLKTSHHFLKNKVKFPRFEHCHLGLVMSSEARGCAYRAQLSIMMSSSQMYRYRCQSQALSRNFGLRLLLWFLLHFQFSIWRNLLSFQTRSSLLICEISCLHCGSSLQMCYNLITWIITKNLCISTNTVLLGLLSIFNIKSATSHSYHCISAKLYFKPNR